MCCIDLFSNKGGKFLAALLFSYEVSYFIVFGPLFDRLGFQWFLERFKSLLYLISFKLN